MLYLYVVRLLPEAVKVSLDYMKMPHMEVLLCFDRLFISCRIMIIYIHCIDLFISIENRYLCVRKIKSL